MPARWSFPDLRDPAIEANADELIAYGADLEPETLLTAYADGYFPMPGPGREVGWWSPVERGVLPLSGLRVSRSLRASCRRYEVRVDTVFADVVARCADPDRDGAWIDDAITAAYVRLHELGHAHSVETWYDDELVGGLYGVSLGGLFAGESMFHRARDASKVALVALVDLLGEDHRDERVLDVQWQTPHLASLGVVAIERSAYLERLDVALDIQPPSWTAGVRRPAPGLPSR